MNMESPKQEQIPETETLENETEIEKLKAENALLKERIEYLEKELDIDSLTGTSNRRAFDKEIEQSLKLIRGEVKEHRTGIEQTAEISLVAVDIDNFKNVNDTFGHGAGDEVLQKVSAVLMESVRDGDMVARMSGGADELMVLLRGANIESAIRKAEEFRAKIESLTFDANAELKVTVSLGVCSSTESTDSENLKKMVDNALYTAKESGRNQVKEYTEEK